MVAPGTRSDVVLDELGKLGWVPDRRPGVTEDRPPDPHRRIRGGLAAFYEDLVELIFQTFPRLALQRRPAEPFRHHPDREPSGPGPTLIIEFKEQQVGD